MSDGVVGAKLHVVVDPTGAIAGAERAAQAVENMASRGEAASARLARSLKNASDAQLSESERSSQAAIKVATDAIRESNRAAIAALQARRAAESATDLATKTAAMASARELQEHAKAADRIAKDAIAGARLASRDVKRIGDSAADAAQTAKSSADRMKSAFHDVSLSVNKLKDGFMSAKAGLMSLVAVLGAGALAKGFVERMIEVNETYNGFVASMSVARGSMAAGRQEYDYLLSVSSKLGINLESVIQTYSKLALSMSGVEKSGRATRHIFEAISEASTVLHLKGHKTDLIFTALEQAASKGKFSLEEFQRQLSNHLPGAMSLVAEAMKKSKAELGDAVSSGTLNVYDVLVKLANLIKTKYGDAATVASLQYTAMLNKMKVATFELYRTVGTSGAMDGLTKIVDVVTKKLSADGLGVELGSTLGEIFSDIASGLDKITASDVREFMLGVSAVFKTVWVLTSEVVKSFGDMQNQESGMLGFCEAVAKGLIVLADSLAFVVAGIAEIPLAINSAWKFAKLIAAEASSSPLAMARAGVRPGSAEYDKRMKDRFAAEDDMRAAAAMLNKNHGVLLNTSESPMSKAWKKSEEIFAAARASAAKRVSQPAKKKMDVDLNPLSNAQLDDILSELGVGNGTTKKKGRGDPVANATESEMVRLTKARMVAENDLANVLSGRSLKEGKLRAELEAKLLVDKEFIAMSPNTKRALLAAADAADAAREKAESASKAQRYVVDNAREMAAIDRRLEASRSGRRPSAYNEAVTISDSFKPGGSNSAVNPEDQAAMLASASKKDEGMRAADMGEFIVLQREKIEQMKFETSLYGESEARIASLTRAREIDLEVQRMAIEATDEQRASLMEYARILKEDVQAAIDQHYAKQTDYQAGAKQGMQAYSDQLSNVAANTSSYVQSVGKSMEDMFVNAFTTGTLSVKEFVKTMLAGLIRIMVQALIMKPIMDALMASMGGGGGGGLIDSGASMLGGGRGGGMAGRNTGAGGGGGGGLFSGWFANGGVFESGAVKKFADGGVFTNSIVDRATNFAFGQMGERGPEAIVPLRRDASGRLGVSAVGGAGGGTVLNHSFTAVVNMPNDASGGTDKRAADMDESLKAMFTQWTLEQKRPGGLLYTPR